MWLLKALPCLLLTIIVLFSCRKESENLSVPSLTDYYPLQVGQSYTYRLDSTLYVAFGTAIQINSYIAKDSIINTFADNLGRPSFLVYRYLSDTLQSRPFSYSLSYYITPTAKTIEVTDADNLRYIKLTEPAAASTSWNGNVYIDASDSKTLYLNGWQYQYQNINQPFTTLAGTMDSAITVLQDDDSSLTDPADPTVIHYRTYSSEVYAKGIGLIYKDLVYWVKQPTGGLSPGYYCRKLWSSDEPDLTQLNLFSCNRKEIQNTVFGSHRQSLFCIVRCVAHISVPNNNWAFTKANYQGSFPASKRFIIHKQSTEQSIGFSVVALYRFCFQ